jgi:hypothetical protein
VFESSNTSGNQMTIDDGLISFKNTKDSNHATVYIDCQYENSEIQVGLRHSKGSYLGVGTNGVVIGSRD